MVLASKTIILLSFSYRCEKLPSFQRSIQSLYRSIYVSLPFLITEIPVAVGLSLIVSQSKLPASHDTWHDAEFCVSPTFAMLPFTASNHVFKMSFPNSKTFGKEKKCPIND